MGSIQFNCACGTQWESNFSPAQCPRCGKVGQPAPMRPPGSGGSDRPTTLGAPPPMMPPPVPQTADDPPLIDETPTIDTQSLVLAGSIVVALVVFAITPGMSWFSMSFETQDPVGEVFGRNNTYRVNLSIKGTGKATMTDGASEETKSTNAFGSTGTWIIILSVLTISGMIGAFAVEIAGPRRLADSAVASGATATAGWGMMGGLWLFGFFIKFLGMRSEDKAGAMVAMPGAGLWLGLIAVVAVVVQSVVLAHQRERMGWALLGCIGGAVPGLLLCLFHAQPWKNNLMEFLRVVS
jgi:hypothetical protein